MPARIRGRPVTRLAALSRALPLEALGERVVSLRGARLCLALPQGGRASLVHPEVDGKEEKFRARRDRTELDLHGAAACPE